MNEMRITLVNKYFLPVEGGIERHVADLAEALGNRPEIGRLNILVANTNRQREVTPLPKGRLLRLPSLGRFASAPLTDFRPGLRELDSDIYHFHFPNPLGELAWLLMGGHAGKLVVTYHSDIVRQQLLLKGLAPFIRRFLHRADRIIATSPALAEQSPWLQPVRAKVRVVPLGIRTERFDPLPATLAAAQRFRAEWCGGPTVLYVGRLVYYKGLPVLLEAMKGVPAQLVIAGDGVMRSELEAQATALGIRDRVRFLGRVSDDDLPALYRAADLMVLPSTARSEAYGLVQLEAHASGIPVVSTRLPTGVPWVNQDGRTGLTVPPGNAGALRQAIAHLLTHEEERRRMGADAAERARAAFSLGAMADGVLQVYQELL